jgi:hypothetical protein
MLPMKKMESEKEIYPDLQTRTPEINLGMTG